MPLSHGYSLIRTPDFCIKAMNLYTGQSARGGPAPGASAAGGRGVPPAGGAGAGRAQGAGYNWGRGQVLGAE